MIVAATFFLTFTLDFPLMLNAELKLSGGQQMDEWQIVQPVDGVIACLWPLAFSTLINDRQQSDGRIA